MRIIMIKEITELYVWIRKNNMHAPDEIVDFMFEAAKEKLKINEKPCDYCKDFVKSVGSNYCRNCGRELPER